MTIERESGSIWHCEFTALCTKESVTVVRRHNPLRRMNMGNSTQVKSPITHSAPGRRLTSQVVRETRAGETVYVKTLVSTEWEGSNAALRARIEREARLLERLRNVSKCHPRLGSQQVASWDADRFTIVTRQVSGAPLDSFLSAGGSSVSQRNLQKAMWLAGRWLAAFQALAYEPEDTTPIGNRTPVDLIEYSRIRLEILAANYRWMTPDVSQAVLKRIAAHLDHASDDDHGLVWCHGDYSPGNIMWDGLTLTPIDFTMARVAQPLLDVTYFIHRLQMLSIYRPWERRPVSRWTAAFLRGYGRPDAASSPMYQALMIRHLICRLLTYVLRKPVNAKQRLHAKWVRACVRNRILTHLNPR